MLKSKNKENTVNLSKYVAQTTNCSALSSSKHIASPTTVSNLSYSHAATPSIRYVKHREFILIIQLYNGTYYGLKILVASKTNWRKRKTKTMA